MREYIDQKGLKNLRVVDTLVAETESDLQNIFKQFISEGYEGVVARNPEGLYEYSINGKRSKDVLRCKPRRDLDV
jgi:ATP-dependent DNA ligase